MSMNREDFLARTLVKAASSAADEVDWGKLIHSGIEKTVAGAKHYGAKAIEHSGNAGEAVAKGFGLAEDVAKDKGQMAGKAALGLAVAGAGMSAKDKYDRWKMRRQMAEQMYDQY